MSDDETPPQQNTNDIYEEPEVMPIWVARAASYSPEERREVEQIYEEPQRMDISTTVKKSRDPQ
jgi:hypothetical protein